MRLRSSQSGFTLLEAVVMIGVFSGFLAIVHGTFRSQRGTFDREAAVSVTQTGVRYWLERIARDVRRACYDPQATDAFGITTREPAEIRLSFATDADADGVADGAGVAGYRLQDGVLQYWHGSGWRNLVDGVENLSFLYRDTSGKETTESVALVEIGLGARPAPGNGGISASVVTQTLSAEVRNDSDCQN